MFKKTMLLTLAVSLALSTGPFVKKRKIVAQNKPAYEFVLSGNINVATTVFVSGKLLEANGDPVKMHINSNGGDVWAGELIIAAMDSYRAKYRVNIDCYIADKAYSMAAGIALACSNLELSNNAELLFHNVKVCTFTDCYAYHNIDLDDKRFAPWWAIREWLYKKDLELANQLEVITHIPADEILNKLNPQWVLRKEDACATRIANRGCY